MVRQRLTLEQLVYQRLKASNGSLHEIIKFPAFFSKVCPIFCLTKEQAWTVLRAMEESGMVEIVPYHGVRVKSQ